MSLVLTTMTDGHRLKAVSQIPRGSLTQKLEQLAQSCRKTTYSQFSLARYPQVSASVPNEDSFWRGKIKEVNPSVPSLQMPFKEAVFPIWASKRPFIAVHIQRGLTFAGRIGQPVDIKILCIPRVTIVLQIPEPTHDSSEARLIPSENLDLRSRLNHRSRDWGKAKAFDSTVRLHLPGEEAAAERNHSTCTSK